MKYFNPTDSIYDITERFPVTLAIFISHGFSQMADESKRNTFGKALQFEIAVAMRQLDQQVFVEKLEAAIESFGSSVKDPEKVYVKGLLPCPVRLPLQECLDEAIANEETAGITVQAELKAASMGLGWMKEEVAKARDASELDDIYISAGFDMFFDTAYFGRFIQSGAFSNPVPWKSVNPDFDQENFRLSDPKGRYGIIAVVPAVFLVNTEVLAGRAIPQSWKDLLDPMYERSVSLPVADFDLFNAILLTIDNTYGPDAVRALGRNMLKSLHPAQMVKSHNHKSDRPAITIMPYFFTKMVKEGGVMKAVWPKDGAIISPVFMIGKTAKPSVDRVSAIIAGEKVASILAHQGLFPSLHPDIDNRLPESAGFLWIGWDYIDSHDLNERFEACEALFNESFVKEIVEL